jgi:hypothetical protein
VLSENIFEIDPEKIREAKLLHTIINGKQVFAKKIPRSKQKIFPHYRTPDQPPII